MTTLVAASTGCGARSALLEPQQDEVQNGGSGAGGMPGGGRAGQGGTSPVAGAPSVGGLPSFGGTSPIAGAAGVAGVAGQAGMPSTCTLSFSDCAGPNEPECAGEREECSGYVPWFATFSSNEAAYLADVVTGRDGRVAVTGYHTGTTSISGTSGVFVSPPGVEQAILASFSSRSADVQDVGLDFTYTDAGEPKSRGISVEMALNGDALLQTQRSTGSVMAGALVRLNVAGEPTFREYSGSSTSVAPTALGIDNDGRAWSGGDFVNDIWYRNQQLYAGGGAPVGYLMQVDSTLGLLQMVPVRPTNYLYSDVTALAVDDEDHVLALGSSDNFSYFLRKLAVDGSLVFEKVFERNLVLTNVVVDRNMRSTVFGYFSFIFTNEGQKFTPNGVSLFVAQYSREGELLWQRAFGDAAISAAAAVDPNGNLVLVGSASELVLSDRTLVAEHQGYPGAPNFTFVLKLRPDGKEVWAKSCDGNFVPKAVAADNAGTIWLAGTVNDAVFFDESAFSAGISRPTGLLARFRP